MTDIDEGVTFIIPDVVTEKKTSFNVGPESNRRAVRVDAADRKQFKALCRMVGYEAMQAAGLPIYDEPVMMAATWFRRRPSGQRKHDIFPHKRPDTKNYLAILEDALEGVVYEDDARIVTHSLRKRFAEEGTPERVEVRIMPEIRGYPYRRPASPPPEAQPCHPTSATTASEDGGGAEAR